jgi:hypothetical protein
VVNKKRAAWRELMKVCRKIHSLLYAKNNREAALEQLAYLETLLETLPTNSGAILQEEGLALRDELKNEWASALLHREKELLLIQELHLDIRRNNYPRDLAVKLLKGYGAKDVSKRRDILTMLTDKGRR